MYRPLLTFLWLSAMMSAADPVQCPATVSVRQVATDIPAGWTAGTSAVPVELAGITFFEGNPQDEASLVYDRLTPTSTGTRAVWTFAQNSHIWLSCSYAATRVVLSKLLPPV